MAIRTMKVKELKKMGLMQSDKITRRQKSAYALLLNERRKLLTLYNIRARQLRTMMQNNLYENVFQKCESLLSTVVYRLGFAASPRAAAQLISHGHILVNNRCMAHKMYTLSNGDVVAIKPEIATNSHINEAIKKNKISFSHLKSEGHSGVYERTADVREMYLSRVNFADACNPALRFK